MNFDFNSWKQSVSQNAKGWKERFQRARVNTLYYGLAATSLFPVVQAFHKGEMAPALIALGGISAGVGANLLANKIQGWKDKSEAEIAADLQSAPELREVLDQLLEKMETIAAAQNDLNTDAERKWFEQTLKEEIGRVGSRITFTATLVGSGAIAQGNGATAVGAGGMYVGGNYTVQNAPDPKQIEADKNESARRNYLERLRRFCQSLPLAVMGGDEGVDDEVSLERIYVELDTNLHIKQKELEALRKGEKVDLTRSEQRMESPEQEIIAMQRSKHPEEQMVSVPVFEAVIATPRAVLLGDPGAGKSTFVRYLVAMQSAVTLKECAALRGVEAELMPVFITLRDLAPRLLKLEMDHLPAEKQNKEMLKVLREHIQAELVSLNAEEFFPDLCRQLEKGNVLLVMDGLDEVPHNARACIRQTVNAAIKEYKPQRLIVTCRIRSYTGSAVLSLPSFTLQPFDQKKIQRFVQAWYKTQTDLGHFTVEQAKLRAEDLSKAATGSDLRELSSNPMMLTSMAIIHQKEIGLPRERVKLYNLAVDVLLRRWQKSKVGLSLVPSEGLAAFLKDDLRLRATLERLAYESHRASMKDKEGADLPRGMMLDLLDHKEYLGGAGLASEFLDYVDQRAGLLIGRGGSDESHPSTYSFPHRTFQEYLAGCYLIGQRDLIRLFVQHATEGDFWDLAVLLGIEELYFNRKNINTLLDLAYGLCPAAKPKNEAGRRALLWSGEISKVVGLDKVLIDTLNPNGGKKYIARLKPSLIALLNSKLSAVERAEAGCVLAKLGDPRPEVTSVEAMQFCHVPAGEFSIGDDEKHTLDLPEFWMSQYPITNAQFNQFVEAGGYAEAHFWSEAREASIWRDGKIHLEWANEIREAPKNFGEPFCLANHPVVGITWYEALAFTRWLTEKVRSEGCKLKVYDPQTDSVSTNPTMQSLIVNHKLDLCLPSEAEWEKAARSTDGREYPWGGEFDRNKANTSETGIGSTSAVGCFAGGASSYGLQDMSGNVWEWTRSVYKQYPYEVIDGREDLTSKDTRVLRGGSFYNGFNGARCAARNGDAPVDLVGGYGFRVAVVSPVLPSRL